MKIHLYEFRSDKRKLTCSCGWERSVKGDFKQVHRAFAAHRLEMASKS